MSKVRCRIRGHVSSVHKLHWGTLQQERTGRHRVGGIFRPWDLRTKDWEAYRATLNRGSARVPLQPKLSVLRRRNIENRWVALFILVIFIASVFLFVFRNRLFSPSE